MKHIYTLIDSKTNNMEDIVLQVLDYAENGTPKEQWIAFNWIADRRWGKPTVFQEIDQNVNVSLGDLLDQVGEHEPAETTNTTSDKVEE